MASGITSAINNVAQTGITQGASALTNAINNNVKNQDLANGLNALISNATPIISSSINSALTSGGKTVATNDGSTSSGSANTPLD